MKNVVYFGDHCFRVDGCAMRKSPVANLEMLIKRDAGVMPPPIGFHADDLVGIGSEILSTYALGSNGLCILMVDKVWAEENDMTHILKHLDSEWENISVYLFDPDEEATPFVRVKDGSHLEDLEAPDGNDR